MSCPYTKLAKGTLGVMLSMTASVALADGITTAFSGYGTVGGAFISDGHYTYVHDATDFTGASNSIDVGLESRIGVQATVSFDSQWSITAQEEAKQRGNTNFDPGTEWLYAQYQPTPDWKFRLGRVVLPTFLVSDTIDVGYAAPWFRAPNEVYGAEPFDYLDGAQAIWQHSLGPFQLNLETSYGQGKALLFAGGVIVTGTGKDVFNAAVSLSWRNLLLRYSETDINAVLSVPLSSTDALSLNVHDKFHSVGLQYDDGKALFMSEWASRGENNLPGFGKPYIRGTVWYAAAGWRIDKFTPLLMYSGANYDDGLLGQAISVGTWAASLRYDVVRNLDLKLQISRPQAANGAYFLDRNPASNVHVNVYSLGADFVF
jgi:hypothetical protein